MQSLHLWKKKFEKKLFALFKKFPYLLNDTSNFRRLLLHVLFNPFPRFLYRTLQRLTNIEIGEKRKCEMESRSEVGVDAERICKSKKSKSSNSG